MTAFFGKGNAGGTEARAGRKKTALPLGPESRGEGGLAAQTILHSPGSAQAAFLANLTQRKHAAMTTRITSISPKASMQHCAMLMNLSGGTRYQLSELL